MWGLKPVIDPRYGVSGIGSTSGDQGEIRMAVAMGKTLTLTGWQGGTSGLRVAAESRRKVLLPLKRTLRRVRLVLPDHGQPPVCDVSASFWTSCPELRSAEIGRWMIARRDKPWPPRNPPTYEAELVAIEGGMATIRIVD